MLKSLIPIENIKNSYICTNTTPADGLAPLGTVASIDAVMTRLGATCIYNLGLPGIFIEDLLSF